MHIQASTLIQVAPAFHRRHTTSSKQTNTPESQRFIYIYVLYAALTHTHTHGEYVCGHACIHLRAKVITFKWECVDNKTSASVCYTIAKRSAVLHTSFQTTGRPCGHCIRAVCITSVWVRVTIAPRPRTFTHMRADNGERLDSQNAQDLCLTRSRLEARNLSSGCSGRIGIYGVNGTTIGAQCSYNDVSDCFVRIRCTDRFVGVK